MVSSHRIEKPLSYEFQQDKYTIFGLYLKMPYGDHPNLLEARILRQPSASVPDGPEPHLVLTTAFLIISSSTDWNLTG